MILDGRELAGYIMQRQSRQARASRLPPRLAIVRQGATPATDLFLRVKQSYGRDIGVAVDTYTESPETLLKRIYQLNEDEAVTGIIIQLPLADAPEMADKALAAVALAKDVDGLAPKSPYDVATRALGSPDTDCVRCSTHQ